MPTYMKALNFLNAGQVYTFECVIKPIISYYHYQIVNVDH